MAGHDGGKPFVASSVAAVAIMRGGADRSDSITRVPQQQTAQVACETEPGRLIECVRPSETDPAIRAFDDAHYILYSVRAKADADLLVFMTGTGGEPPGP